MDNEERTERIMSLLEKSRTTDLTPEEDSELDELMMSKWEDMK